MTDEQMALVARGLAHPARIRIIHLLAAQTECRGHEVFSELPLAQSTVSEHIRFLKEAGLVQSRPAGSTGMVYCLVASVLDEFKEAVGDIAANATACTTGQRGC